MSTSLVKPRGDKPTLRTTLIPVLGRVADARYPGLSTAPPDSLP